MTGPPIRPDGPVAPSAPAAPAAPPPGARSRRLVRALAVAVVPAIVAVAVVVALRDDADDPPDDTELADPPATEPPTTEDPPSTPPSSEPSPTPDPTVEPRPEEPPPSEWRPEVVELVRFVERERQLAFEHPVEVELLSEQEYLTRTGGDQGSMGFYDGQGIVVRGTELTPALRGTIVHELTHAIDDQHFNLAALEGRAGSPEQLAVLRHLIEGDAVRMEWAYDAMLIRGGASPAEVFDQVHAGVGAPGVPAPVPPPAAPPTTAPAPGGSGGGTTTTTVDSRGQGASRRQVPGSPDEAADPALPYGASVPELGGALDVSSYFIGKQLIDVLVARGGNAAVDAAFRDPPRTTEQVLDPRAYLARDEPREVRPSSEVVPKSEFQDQTSLGALNLYVVLAAGIDPVVALDAATGWGGESVQAYTDDHGHSCVQLAVVGDTEADTEEIHEAFAAWVDSGFAAHSSADRRGDGTPVLTACAFGADSPVTDPFDALVLAEVRGAQMWAAMRDARMDAGDAFAFGSCVVHAVPLDTLLAPPTGDGLPASTESALEDAAATC